MFARPPVIADPQLMVDMLNGIHGWGWTKEDLDRSNREVLRTEIEFNRRIEIFGQLAPGKERRQTLDSENLMTVQEIASFLGLDAEEIGLISINGVQSEMADPVPPGCRLCFFPPMSGG